MTTDELLTSLLSTFQVAIDPALQRMSGWCDGGEQRDHYRTRETYRPRLICRGMPNELATIIDVSPSREAWIKAIEAGLIQSVKFSLKDG